ncbi:SDR family NAD(P)-dependent oxidoreductase [Paracoccus sp. YIM 132242]|uniref:SDR family NAD(P)-dependent oxidoreductase n=1 Tax=Paracoccus lichenicola TaxID=2665644 RepID=A0A6L6HRJ5_9RHOB|nr:SDR family NAD(P)-dependent oxidoreductase [Paracoccus lichenicola]MTE01727.1 SDR family NAD(P)-dependent oxidoreductase [Paracoccus lichenicola]
MTKRLEGCVALVTGASSGIGAATAIELAAQGARVILAARRAERLADIAGRIAEAGGEARVLAADIAQRGVPAQLVADAVAAGGRLDILVNAAGVMLNGDSIERPLSEWERMVDLNLMALMAATKAALPHLVEAAKAGRGVADVVNISSIAGRVAAGTVGVYNATKFGVTAFSEALRQEFARRNVRVSVVEPGAVRTELFDHQAPTAQARLSRILSEVEHLHPEDVAEAIAHIVTRPRRVALSEVVIRPTDHL